MRSPSLGCEHRVGLLRGMRLRGKGIHLSLSLAQLSRLLSLAPLLRFSFPSVSYCSYSPLPP